MQANSDWKIQQHNFPSPFLLYAGLFPKSTLTKGIPVTSPQWFPEEQLNCPQLPAVLPITLTMDKDKEVRPSWISFSAPGRVIAPWNTRSGEGSIVEQASMEQTDGWWTPYKSSIPIFHDFQKLAHERRFTVSASLSQESWNFRECKAGSHCELRKSCSPLLSLSQRQNQVAMK